MFTANSSVTLDVTRLTLSFSIPLGPLVQTQVSVLLCIQSLYLERNFWSSVPLVQWAYASARPPCQMAISIMRKKDRLFTSRRKTRSWFLFQRQCLDPKMVVPLLAMVTTRIHCLPSWSIRRRSDRTHNTKILKKHNGQNQKIPGWLIPLIVTDLETPCGTGSCIKASTQRAMWNTQSQNNYGNSSKKGVTWTSIAY